MGILKGEWGWGGRGRESGTQVDYKGLVIVTVTSPAVSAGWKLWKLGFYLPRHWETKVLSFMITFQRNGFPFLETDTLELQIMSVHLKGTEGGSEF